MTESARLEFEAAVTKHQLAGGFPPANLERCKLDGNYALQEVAAAWWGWQASREALVIALPSFKSYPAGFVEGAHWMQHDCKVAIEAAGLKVKP